MTRLTASAAVAVLLGVGVLSAPAMAQGTIPGCTTVGSVIDTDHDGWIAGDERRAARSAGYRFDLDGNGFVTPDEYNSCLGGTPSAGAYPQGGQVFMGTGGVRPVGQQNMPVFSSGDSSAGFSQPAPVPSNAAGASDLNGDGYVSQEEWNATMGGATGAYPTYQQ